MDVRCRLAFALAFTAQLALSSCASDVSSLAPADPTVPWPIPADLTRGAAAEKAPAVSDKPAAVGSGAAGDGEATPGEARAGRSAVALPDLEGPGAPSIDHARTYDLPALIDIAQRNSPVTREAWERARMAALSVGLVESSYAPQLSAEAIAGFQRTPLPIPSSLIPKGYFTANTAEFIPSLTVKWLLFDFGRRQGTETSARENSFVANVAFTGEHQKLIFAVSRDYYALGAARGKLRAALNGERAAATDLAAVEGRYANGLATSVELAQARRQAAQAQFDAVRASGVERRAYAALLATMGLSPTTVMTIDDSLWKALPHDAGAKVDEYVSQALAQRPDIIAALGKIRAARATLEKERAEHRPTISLSAQAYQNIGALSTDGSAYSNVDRPGGAVFLNFSVPLLDGGRRDFQASIASAEVNAVQDALAGVRTQAAREVVDAYHSLETALAENQAAEVLTEAARTAHAGALESYRHGVGTYTTLVDSQNELVRAETQTEDARANIMTAKAALAFATGSIAADSARH